MPCPPLQPREVQFSADLRLWLTGLGTNPETQLQAESPPMTPDHRNRIRAKTAAGLTTALLTLLIAGALRHPGHLTSILLILTAALGATTATLAAAFAPTTATRTAARHTLDLLLRLVPWYTPRS